MSSKAPGNALDKDVVELQAQSEARKDFEAAIVSLMLTLSVDSLRLQRAALKTALVEAQTSQKTVDQQTSSSAQVVRSWAAKGRSDAAGPRTRAALGDTKARAKHDQESLYRLAAGATMFEVKDPDPHAVDGGRVLGIRIEVCIGSVFVRAFIVQVRLPGSHPVRQIPDAVLSTFASARSPSFTLTHLQAYYPSLYSACSTRDKVSPLATTEVPWSSQRAKHAPPPTRLTRPCSIGPSRTDCLPSSTGEY